MDVPIGRTREHDGLRIDEQLVPETGRVITELRADIGEAHEPPRWHGIGYLLLVMAREAARRPGVDAQSTATLDRSALRFDGRPEAVAAALAAATAELAEPTRERFEAARAELRGVPATVTIGSLARWVRFGIAGFGTSALDLYAVSGASLEDVRAWAANWHGGTVSLASLGEVPDFAQHLPATGPTPPAPSVLSARTLPGTAAWTLPMVGLSWVGGWLPEDRAAAVVLTERLRERTVGAGPAERIESAVESLEPGTQHLVVALRPAPGRDDELATVALEVLDELAEVGPGEVELIELVDSQRRAGAAADLIEQPGAGGADERDGNLAAAQLTPDSVAAAARRIRSDLLLLRPGQPSALGDLPVATVREPGRLEGAATKRLRSALWTRQRRTALELYEDGVRVVQPDARVVVSRTSAAVALRHRDGTRTVLGRDGRQVHVDPAAWSGGRRAVGHVDTVFQEVAVEAPPVGGVPPQMRAAASSGRWLIMAVAGALLALLGLGGAVGAATAGGPFALLGALAIIVGTGAGLWLCVTFVRERFAVRRAVRYRDSIATG